MSSNADIELNSITTQTNELKNKTKQTKESSIVEANKSDDQAIIVDEKQVDYFELLRYAEPVDWFMLVVGGLLAAANGVALPMFSLVFGDILNNFNRPLSTMLDAVRQDALYFIYIAIASFFASWGSVTFYMMVGDRQAKRIREEYVRAILRQDMAWFNQHQTGELATRLSADTELIADGLSQKASSYIQFNTTFVSGLIIGLTRGWQLALVIIALTPLLAVAGGVMAQLLVKLAKEGSDRYAEAGGIADEVLTSVRTVQSINNENFEHKRYSYKLIEAMDAGIHSAVLGSFSLGIVMLIIFGSYGLALWYGSKLIIDQTINAGTGNPYTGGDVVAVFFSTLMGAFALGQAAPSIPAFNSAKGAAYRIFETIDRIPPIDAKKKGRVVEKLKGNILFENVHFAYPSRPDALVLKGLNLTIPIGKTVALVGHSGCGKSTIINLLERWYDPLQGRILVDGIDLKELDLSQWRNVMGLVQQEPILFSVSLKDNIKFGNENATDEEIEKALVSANALEFVDKIPGRLNSMTGESGNEQMSGGQKQRIAICRAIVRNPEILLLDEATSALDNESEKVVQAALDKIMPGKTSILIAHRLTTIRHADIICVFDEGVIVEQGNHDELFEKKGLYTALVLADQKKQSSHSTVADNVTVVASSSGADGVKVLEKLVSEKSLDIKVESKVEEQKTNPEEPSFPLSRLISLSSEHWDIIVISLFSSICAGAVFPLFSQIFSEMISVLFLPLSDPDAIRVRAANMALAFFGLGIGMLLANVGMNGGFGYIGEKLTKKLRDKSFAALLNQNIGWFDEEMNQPRVLCAKLATDAAAVKGMASEYIGRLIQIYTMLIAGTVLAFYYGWQLAFVVFGIGPLVGVAGWLQFKFIGGFSNDFKKALEKGSQLAAESFSGIKTVSSFNSEELVVKKYSHILEEPLEIGRFKAQVAGIGFGFAQAIMFLAYAISFYFGAWLVNEGLMTFDRVLKVFFAIIMAAMGVGQTAAFVPDIVKSNSAAHAVFGIIDRSPEIDSSSDSGLKSGIESGDITFDNVSFSYPTRKETRIFKKLSFDIKCGSKVALVGPSGSGKSTVVSMLMRFYDPDSGNIKIAGENLKNYNIKYLRSQIGTVSQEPVLFNRSILENIRAGRPKATDDECIAAAKSANVEEFVSEFPDKYNTIVGPRGGQLSGGQKQRIAIARAVLRNPKILLLDEATSALDNNSEVIVQEALNNLMLDRTTLIVAHRLSTIRNADLIVVMKDGDVVEIGKYDELIVAGGLFAALAATKSNAST